MKDIYEFVYLYIYNISTNNGEKKSDGSALATFTALLTINVMFPVMVYILLSNEKLNLKWFVIALSAGLAVVNYFLFVFHDESLVRIKLKWEKKTSESKILWKKNIYRYIIASILLFVSPIIIRIIIQFS